jgi:hypothetical protein
MPAWRGQYFRQVSPSGSWARFDFLEGGGLRGGAFAGDDGEGLLASDPGAGFDVVLGGVHKADRYDRTGFSGKFIARKRG